MPKFIRTSPIYENDLITGNNSIIFDNTYGILMSKAKKYSLSSDDVNINFQEYNGQKIINTSNKNEELILKYTTGAQYLSDGNFVIDGSCLSLDPTFSADVFTDDYQNWFTIGSGMWSGNFQGSIYCWFRVDEAPGLIGTHPVFSIAEQNPIDDSNVVGQRNYLGLYSYRDIFSVWMGYPIDNTSWGYLANIKEIPVTPGIYFFYLDTNTGTAYLNGEKFAQFTNVPFNIPNTCKVSILSHISNVGDGLGVYSFRMKSNLFLSTSNIKQLHQLGIQSSYSRLKI